MQSLELEGVRALLLDMDGVLADVAQSYRQAIVLTVKRFGAETTLDEISLIKARGNANNDWVLTQRILAERGITISLQEVTTAFEELYQGTSSTPGLCELETLIPAKGLLQELHRRVEGRCAIVTGRPKKDCAKFLHTHGLQELYPVCVCMEDAELKPSPAPVLLACKLLSVDPSAALMVGDTPDDIRSAVGAGAIGIGVLTPEADAQQVLAQSSLYQPSPIVASMESSGAAKIIRAGMAELLDVLPWRPSENATLNAPVRRSAEVRRVTKETEIRVVVTLDGTGSSQVNTKLGFFDHMIEQLSKHSRMDITCVCNGDTHIDDHHTIEDCSLALGEAFDKALGARKGIRRWGSALCPLDESLARAVIDVSSRPFSLIDLQFTREKIGEVSTEMLQHALHSFAAAARVTLHVHVLHGTNNHHKAESAFKALAVAIREAVSLDESAGVPSTKGVLA